MFSKITDKLSYVKEDIESIPVEKPRLHAATLLTKNFAAATKQAVMPDLDVKDVALHAVLAANPLLGMLAPGLLENSEPIKQNLKQLITGRTEELLEEQNQSLDYQTQLLENESDNIATVRDLAKETNQKLDDLENILESKPVVLDDETIDKIKDNPDLVKTISKNYQDTGKKLNELVKLNKKESGTFAKIFKVIKSLSKIGAVAGLAYGGYKFLNKAKEVKTELELKSGDVVPLHEASLETARRLKDDFIENINEFNPKEKFEQVKNYGKSLKERPKETISKTIENTKEKINNLKEKTKEIYKEKTENTQETINNIKEKFSEKYETLRQENKIIETLNDKISSGLEEIKTKVDKLDEKYHLQEKVKNVKEKVSEKTKNIKESTKETLVTHSEKIKKYVQETPKTAHIKNIGEALTFTGFGKAGGALRTYAQLQEGDLKGAGISLLHMTPLSPMLQTIEMLQMGSKLIKGIIDKQKQKNLEDKKVFDKNIKEKSLEISKENEKQNKDLIETVDNKIETIKGSASAIQTSATAFLDEPVKLFTNLKNKITGFVNKDIKQDDTEKNIEKEWQYNYKNYKDFAGKTVKNLFFMTTWGKIAQGTAEGSLGKIAWGMIGQKVPWIYYPIEMSLFTLKTVSDIVRKAPGLIKDSLHFATYLTGKTIDSMKFVVSKSYNILKKGSLISSRLLKTLGKAAIDGTSDIIKGTFALFQKDKNKLKELGLSPIASAYQSFSELFSKDTLKDLGKSINKNIFSKIKSIPGELKDWWHGGIIPEKDKFVSKPGEKEEYKKVPGSFRESLRKGFEYAKNKTKETIDFIKRPRKPEEKEKPKENFSLFKSTKNLVKRFFTKPKTLEEKTLDLLSEQVKIQKEQLQLQEKTAKVHGIIQEKQLESLHEQAKESKSLRKLMGGWWKKVKQWKAFDRVKNLFGTLLSPLKNIAGAASNFVSSALGGIGGIFAGKALGGGTIKNALQGILSGFGNAGKWIGRGLLNIGERFLLPLLTNPTALAGIMIAGFTAYKLWQLKKAVFGWLEARKEEKKQKTKLNATYEKALQDLSNEAKEKFGDEVKQRGYIAIIDEWKKGNLVKLKSKKLFMLPTEIDDKNQVETWKEHRNKGKKSEEKTINETVKNVVKNKPMVAKTTTGESVKHTVNKVQHEKEDINNTTESFEILQREMAQKYGTYKQVGNREIMGLSNFKLTKLLYDPNISEEEKNKIRKYFYLYNKKQMLENKEWNDRALKHYFRRQKLTNKNRKLKSQNIKPVTKNFTPEIKENEGTIKEKTNKESSSGLGSSLKTLMGGLATHAIVQGLPRKGLAGLMKYALEPFGGVTPIMVAAGAAKGLMTPQKEYWDKKKGLNFWDVISPYKWATNAIEGVKFGLQFNKEYGELKEIQEATESYKSKIEESRKELLNRLSDKARSIFKTKIENSEIPYLSILPAIKNGELIRGEDNKFYLAGEDINNNVVPKQEKITFQDIEKQNESEELAKRMMEMLQEQKKLQNQVVEHTTKTANTLVQQTSHVINNMSQTISNQQQDLGDIVIRNYRSRRLYESKF